MSYKDTARSFLQVKSDNQTIPDYTDFLDPADTASLLDVSVGTLAVWRCTERYKLPYLKVGGKVKYRLRDIEDFLAERLVIPKSHD